MASLFALAVVGPPTEHRRGGMSLLDLERKAPESSGHTLPSFGKIESKIPKTTLSPRSSKKNGYDSSTTRPHRIYSERTFPYRLPLLPGLGLPVLSRGREKEVGRQGLGRLTDRTADERVGGVHAPHHTRVQQNY